MASLTCGERIVRCFLGEPIDRIPYGIGIGWMPWGQTQDRWVKESGKTPEEISKLVGFDGSFACPTVHYGIFPQFDHTVLSETEEFVVYRDWRGITMRQRRDGLCMPEWLDYPVKNRDDWEKLKAVRLRIDDPGRIPQDWPAFRERLKTSGEAVQVGGFPFGLFGMPRDLMGVEELLMSFYTQPDLVRDIMEHITTLWIALYERVAAEVQIDHVHIWEDMSGRQGSLISPKMVREFMMPHYDRIATFARKAGARIMSVDTDGDCSELLPVMMEHGMNMMFPFEAQAGNDILQVRRLYPTLGIIGGLDKRALAATKKEIDREIDRARQMIRLGGRYVPAFDHLIPPDVPWENYLYAVSEMKKVCFA